MSTSTTLYTLAQRSSQNLMKISNDGQHSGQKNEARQYLRSLSAALLNVNETLKVMPQPLSDTTEGKLLSLLTTLEALFQRPGTGPPDRTRTRTSKRTSNLTSQFPNLSALQPTSAKAKRCIFDLASQAISPVGMPHPARSVSKIQLLETLKDFAKPATNRNKDEGHPTPGDLGLRPKRHHEDHHAAAGSLYDALCQYCYCNDQQIGVKLRLTVESRKYRESSVSSFNALFVVHPHRTDPTAADHWQITTIAFTPPGLPSAAEGGNQTTRMINHDQFCPLVCFEKRSPLNLVLNDNFLSLADDNHRPKLWITTQPSISLRTILENNYKVEKAARYVLMFLLAKALWQFYGTQWMRIPWTIDNVHFLVEHRQGKTGVFLNEPFVSARFSPRESVSVSMSDSSPSATEQARAIEAFGVMLLELEMGMSMRARAMNLEEYDEIKMEDGHYQDVYTARTLINDKDRMAGDGLHYDVLLIVEEVVRACVVPDELQMYYNDPISGSRTAVYRSVIDPIVELVTAQYRNPDAIVLHRPTVPGNSVPVISVLVGSHEQPVTSASVEHLKQTKSIVAGTTMDSGTPSSEKWFGEMSRLNTVLDDPSADSPSTPIVKVVILDTGVRGRFARAVKGYKDFVSNNDTVKTDETGHGTRAVELMFKVFEKAHIYVGRVFQTNDEVFDPDGNTAKNTRDLMAEAIRWAVQDVKADIISIASGFRDDHPPLRSAILDASRAGTLIFAAASNYGNMFLVTYPARMRRHVFCMYSTDGNAKIANLVASINPAHHPKHYNFAILGESIYLSTENTLVTGTSYSTSIAAGLAGRLLHFSRQPGPAGKIRDVKSLKSYGGMQAVFRKMARESCNYDCIAPWSLLDKCPSTMKLEEMRDRVCEGISIDLENKDD
ncbi:hypothetical protein B0H66DRAFT_615264 [Apodospora peruviana]|uniref:Peptidase S8/S53 domain-containing protein n=1 Tax=Apodospora peruviana TaxID=516989 RepID=A0AAE0IH51_9PEZI|nr:hypothetical protein B0H66DRAFT_615264 [Apodospora peruviana]